MTNTTHTVTDDQIEALRIESGQAGDAAQVIICGIALDEYFMAGSQGRCSQVLGHARVIADAAAQS